MIELIGLLNITTTQLNSSGRYLASEVAQQLAYSHELNVFRH